MLVFLLLQALGLEDSHIATFWLLFLDSYDVTTKPKEYILFPSSPVRGGFGVATGLVGG